MNYYKHPSAIIDEGAEIGKGSRIWHFVHVCSGAHIGEEVTLGQNVFVAGRAVIGDGCKIQNNVSVYDGVMLEAFVFCGPSAVFTNVDKPRAAICRKYQYYETMVRRGVTLGANCTIICGVTIGEYAFVGAGSVVTKDVPDFALVQGVPAKQVGWVSEHGDVLDLPVSGKGKAVCKYSGKFYELDGLRLFRSRG